MGNIINVTELLFAIGDFYFIAMAAIFIRQSDDAIPKVIDFSTPSVTGQLFSARQGDYSVTILYTCLL